MDLFVIIWITVWGALPPFIVGYFAYKQGTKGRKEALKLRDEAIAHANIAHDEIAKLAEQMRNFKVEIPPYPTSIRVDPAQMEELKGSINASMKGLWGNIIKTAQHEADDVVDMHVQDMIKTNPQEAIQGAIMSKVLAWLQK